MTDFPDWTRATPFPRPQTARITPTVTIVRSVDTLIPAPNPGERIVPLYITAVLQPFWFSTNSIAQLQFQDNTSTVFADINLNIFSLVVQLSFPPRNMFVAIGSPIQVASQTLITAGNMVVAISCYYYVETA